MYRIKKILGLQNREASRFQVQGDRVMDEIDRKILNLLQEEFPLDPHPFAEIGRRTGLEEREALERVKQLKDSGLIRRIGV
ncbi:MAG TPA: hypothetical protein DCZ04_08225, partial [Syntrophorhabdus aromaticivorans]|nr:hypothetical protein [Syntrophorhabdus aromaticivorans]